MAKVLVIAPHPDDETLGCGGSLLKHKSHGDAINWLIFTTMDKESGFSDEQILSRQKQIEMVSKKYNFNKVYHFDYPAAELDRYSYKDLVSSLSSVLNKLNPEIIYVPNPADVHTDHSIVFKVAESCSKSFRYPFIKSVRVYETLSETGFDLNPYARLFKPNLWINISDHLDSKIDIMRCYEDEIADHPFPRSEQSIRSLASLRGSQSGCHYAEAFMSVKEIL